MKRHPSIGEPLLRVLAGSRIARGPGSFRGRFPQPSRVPGMTAGGPLTLCRRPAAGLRARGGRHSWLTQGAGKGLPDWLPR